MKRNTDKAVPNGINDTVIKDAKVRLNMSIIEKSHRVLGSIFEYFGSVTGGIFFSVQIDVSGLGQFWQNLTCCHYPEKACQCICNIGKITK